jgi:mannose-1-phosphate guanylyltransferase/mannose-1-phosphate guanylyltransferase/mannose-6-phosphate isomerase
VSDLLYPVILSGGAGTRLWPMSRRLYPKQLLPLTSAHSMLQETARRVADPVRFAAPTVVCSDEHRFIVAEQLRQLDIEPRAVLLEPEGRNTAPAIACAALMLRAEAPDAVLLVLPSDHLVGEAEAFRGAVDTAAAAARAGALVTFGITPDRAETGYGYIKRGAPWATVDGCFRVARFTEKPDHETAEAFVKSGEYAWNSGMFVLPAAAYLEELERLQPAVVEACRAALDGADLDLDFLRLEPAAFRAAPSISIDYAVLEHTARAAVVPVDMAWSDVGSWAALWEAGEKDAQGNQLIGDVAVDDVHGSYVRSDGRLAALVGLDDVVLVVTEDAVLAASRERAEEVKRLVDGLIRSGRPETVSHAKVYRPWGHFERLDAGQRYQVKRLTVKPGARLSLQRHGRRAEHWVVVSGTARVTRGSEVFELAANQSTDIPVATAHRLENPGTEPLKLIEVQLGDYLGEDDIVRLADDYGREEAG